MKFTAILAEIFFPRRCLGCGSGIKQGAVCRACFTGIPVNKTFFCGECGGELPIAMKICHPRAPCLIGGAGPYDNPALKALIHNLKFRNAHEAAEPLAELMATFLLSAMPGLDRRSAGGDPYHLLAIPLSRERFFERGYNQTVEIAARLAAKVSLPLATDWLSKPKHTKPQVATGDLQERQENLSGCFRTTNPTGIAGKKIILVDDVATSGSTFAEAAKTLKAAGAKRVIGIAAAKA